MPCFYNAWQCVPRVWMYQQVSLRQCPGVRGSDGAWGGEFGMLAFVQNFRACCSCFCHHHHHHYHQANPPSREASNSMMYHLCSICSHPRAGAGAVTHTLYTCLQITRFPRHTQRLGTLNRCMYLCPCRHWRSTRRPSRPPPLSPRSPQQL